MLGFILFYSIIFLSINITLSYVILLHLIFTVDYFCYRNLIFPLYYELQTRIWIFLWWNKSECRQEKDCGHNSIVLCRAFCTLVRLSLLVRGRSWWRWWRRGLWRRRICSSLIKLHWISCLILNLIFTRTYAYLQFVSEYLNVFHFKFRWILCLTRYWGLVCCICFLPLSISWFATSFIHTHTHTRCPLVDTHNLLPYTRKHTSKQGDRQTDQETYRQTHRHADAPS